jgi:two-component system NtrC family sensor kinase
MGRAELSQNGSPEEMKKALNTILNASETASKILDRFKNLAKPSENSVHKTLVWANAPLDEALELLSHQLKTQNIQICKIKSDRVQVKACHSSLVQVFVNLLINASHVMPKSGQIDITVKKDMDWVEIRLRDYGPGVPEDILPKIKDAFFTTKGDKGTGLGLSICREIIEIEHQGELNFQNHPMTGLEVIIRLPIGGGE